MYDAFISYRHKELDIAVARAVHKQLETYRIPASVRRSSGRRKMGKVFRDQDELPLMADLGEGIRRALEESAWLIVVCTPDLPQSKWCMAEIDHFIALGRRDRILTVLASGEPEQSFPHQLRFTVDDRGNRVEREPLAADVRAGSLAETLKKVKNEKLRLLAPMLGVGYDDLRRRQRERLLRTVAGVSAAVAVVSMGAGAYVLNQNRLLDLQRRQSMENEMALLANRSVVATGEEDRLLGLQYALEALDRNRQLYPGEEAPPYLGEITSALEYATYTRSFQRMVTIKSGGQRVTDLCFSPDDRYVLGIMGGNSAALIDAATGQLIYTVKNNRESLAQAGFSPDGARFFTACHREGTVTIWDTATGEQAAFYATGSELANSLSGARHLGDGRLLLELPGNGYSDPPSLLIWEPETDAIREISAGEALAGSLLTMPCAASPDGAYLVPPNDLGGSLMLIETATGAARALESDGRGYRLTAFSPDGGRLAGASGEFLTIWDVESGRILARRQAREGKDGFGVNYAQAPLYSPNGRLLALSTSSGVTVFDAETLAPKFSLGEPGTIIYSAAFSPDSGLVAGISHSIFIHETASGRLVSDMDGAMVVSAAFSHDGTRLLAGDYEGENGLYSTPASATVTVLQEPVGQLYRAPRWVDPAASVTLEAAHTYGEHLVGEPRLYCDGRYLAQAYPDGFIDVWDLASGEAAPAFGVAEHWLQVTDLIVTERVIVSASMEGRVLIIDPALGTVRHAVSLGDSVGQLELSPAGGLLIARTWAGDRAAVFSTASGKRLFELLPQPGAAFTDVGFTPDGALAAAVQEDGRWVAGRLFATLEELEANAAG